MRGEGVRQSCQEECLGGCQEECLRGCLPGGCQEECLRGCLPGSGRVMGEKESFLGGKNNAL